MTIIRIAKNDEIHYQNSLPEVKHLNLKKNLSSRTYNVIVLWVK